MTTIFKTGRELQQERMQELAESNAAIVKMSGGTQREQANRQIGSLLGTALVGAFMDKPGGTTAGDIEAALPPEIDLQSPEGLLQFQRKLFDSGDDTSALALNKHIKDAITIQAGRKKAKGEDKLASKISPPTGNELSAVRTGLITDQSEFGENLRSIIEGGDEFKIQEVENMVNSMALVEKTIVSQLRDKGKRANPLEVRQLLRDSMVESQVVGDESWFGGFFGKEGVIDIKAQDKLLSQIQDTVFKGLNEVKAKPVEIAPAQRTTEDTLSLTQVIDQDIEGVVEGAGEPRDLGKPIVEKTFKEDVAPVNANIKELVKAMGQAKRGSTELKEMKRLRDIEIDKIRQIRKKHGLPIR